MDSSIPISEQYRITSKTWVDAEAAASLLEDTKSAFLAQKMQDYASEPVSRAEMKVKSSPEWREYIEKMIAARRAANLLKVKLEWVRMKHAEEQSARRFAELYWMKWLHRTLSGEQE